MLTQIIHYFQTNHAQYWGYVGQHLVLSFSVLVIAMLISLPLGYLGSKHPKVALICSSFSQVCGSSPAWGSYSS